jgi:membrane associated rhomboid family serine protease
MAYYRFSGSNYYRPSLFGGFKFFPPVIKTLLISNVAVFLFVNLLSGAFTVGGASLSAVLSSIFALCPLGTGFEPWQLITYLFMHGSFIHLLFNMFALWMFGMELENDWGSKKFLTYYALCGIGAGLSNLFIGPLFGPAAPTVGASGAIYGVLIAFGMIYPDRPIFVYFLLPIRARYFIILFMAMEIYAGVTGTQQGVAHFAHLGGAAVGLVYLLVDRRRLPLQQLWSRTKDRFVPTERMNEYSSVERGRATDAKFYDLNDDHERVNQQLIDSILDKISQYGYQSLTEKEKKILFEASKKLN